MTDQPTQDAIVSQRARDLLEAITGGNFDFKPAAKQERLKMIARFEAEIEAATIERCASHFQAMHDAQPSMENYCFMTYDCIADDLRNLKGQTS